jgi:hypothetical protein
LGRPPTRFCFSINLRRWRFNMANSLVPNSNVSNSFSMCE